jgi:hypothetical protein
VPGLKRWRRSGRRGDVLSTGSPIRSVTPTRCICCTPAYH